MAKRTSYSYVLSADQQQALIHILDTGNYRPLSMPHTKIAAKGENCIIALYNSGKCLVQGRQAEDFVIFVLEPMVLKSAGLGYEEALDPQAAQPRMGIDESGKGDFFGPIVIAAAYVDESLAATMREMDVKDSKQIKSDNKALAMGDNLRRLLGRRFSIVKIGPKAYNRLYAKIRNVNRLLAWAHARAIENLLDDVPGCPLAISDQFGAKQQVEKALLHKGRKIELVQRHHAEADLAVAAASVIARDAFLRAINDMSRKFEIDIPKGASAAVREAAVRLAGKMGPEILLETTKCHFRTTDAVLKELKTDRSVLAPEGQVTSRPVRRRSTA